MAQPGTTFDVVIVGAGISGLAMAIALTQAGIAGRLRVIEQSPAPREFGAGIQLGANAVKALAQLGITDLAAAGACSPAFLQVMDARNGNKIVEAALGDWFKQRHGAPYHTMARADLLTALHNRADDLGVSVSYNTGLTDARRRANGFILHLTSGGDIETGALIGADGLWSQVRKRLRPTARPRYTGQTAWRALVPAGDVAADISLQGVTLWMAAGFHVVHYPIGAGRRLNLAVFTQGATDAEGWDTPGDKHELLAAISATGSQLPPPLERLINSAGGFVKWPLRDISPSIAWGNSNATLIGDAAHPMLPYLAQGAAMGLEDAHVLAGEMNQAGDAEPAFRRFERARARRVCRVQRAARHNAKIFHLAGPLAFARNSALQLGEKINPGALIRRYDWLYGGGPAL